MHFAVIDMKIEAAMGFEEAVGFQQARREKAEIVIELVVIGTFAQVGGLVGTPLKPDAVAVFIRHCFERLAALGVTGIERRVNVDQVN